MILSRYSPSHSKQRFKLSPANSQAVSKHTQLLGNTCCSQHAQHSDQSYRSRDYRTRVTNNLLRFFHQRFDYQFEGTDDSYLQSIDWFVSLQPTFASDQLWNSCITLFSEAIANVLSHTISPDGDPKPSQIEVIITKTTLKIHVWDHGPGFDLEKQLSTLPKLVPWCAESGRGIWMMNKLADSMSYRSHANTTNCLTLQKQW